MARVFVTGATGFIGYHVARILRERGFEVRALVREGSDTEWLRAVDVEIARGDLRDYEGLREAIKGSEQVYHVAADYRLWVPDPRTMYDINVQGTVNVMKGAREAGAAKVVYTSTVGVLAPAKNGTPGNEKTSARLGDMVGHYKKTKFLAEQEVQRFAREGLPVVIVNPTAPIGTMDRKPTPTGRIIVDFLNGKMPAYLDTGLNFVDVEDVAEGHVRASESGVVGERYILGNVNLTLRQFLEVLSRLTGRRPPRWKLPYAPVLCAALIDEGLSRLLRGREPMIPLAGVRMARYYMFFDCSKARTQLGMAEKPLEIAARKALDWYMGSGYVQGGS